MMPKFHAVRKPGPVPFGVVDELLNHWVHRLCAPDLQQKRRGDAQLLKDGVGHFCDHLDRLDGATLGGRWPASNGSGSPR